jgi:hypothetical protein
MTEFLGHTVQYWLELEMRFSKESGMDAPALLNEIVELGAKVRFYESRIRQMAALMERA